MLNLTVPFGDAANAFQAAGEQLRISPLPSVIYLMQRDVINLYRHALTHYLTVGLSASFLQHSSVGTTYQKWAKVTNDDFSMLFFAVGNLLRYTARLLPDMVERPLIEQRRPAKKLTGSYTAWLVAMRLGRLFVGVRCEEAFQLSIMALPASPTPHGAASQPKLLAIESISARNEVLHRVQADGLTELTSLMAIHERYSFLCQQYRPCALWSAVPGPLGRAITFRAFSPGAILARERFFERLDSK